MSGSSTTSTGLAAFMRDLLITARPAQWQKNLLVFIAFVFSAGTAWSLRDPEAWLPLFIRACAAFVLFSAAASGEYFINDAIDAPADALHPRKRLRPVAAGRIARGIAAGIGAGLIIVGIAGAFLLGRPFGTAVLGYATLSAAYSTLLKRIVIADVIAVATGFAIRAIGGAVAIGVAVSPWLYVCTMLGALFIAVMKRRQEVILLEGDAEAHRDVLGEYTHSLLDQMSSVSMAATLVGYSIYTATAENLPRNHAMLITLPVALYGVFRYRLIAERYPDRNADELLRDRPLLLAILVFGSLAAGVLLTA